MQLYHAIFSQIQIDKNSNISLVKKLALKSCRRVEFSQNLSQIKSKIDCNWIRKVKITYRLLNIGSNIGKHLFCNSKNTFKSLRSLSYFQSGYQEIFQKYTSRCVNLKTLYINISSKLK